MRLRNILSVTLAAALAGWILIANFGLSWGISAMNVETTQGLLAGLTLGLLAWLGFSLWQEKSKKGK